ncbi:MAG: tandem-95 repeat protein [Verrucomicrobiae bacterium]
MIHISVANYGANGTDGKDDSAAFQAALNALFASNPKGGYLYIPNGTYDFNSRVSVYANRAWDLAIQGQSKTGVVLRCNNPLGVLQITNTGRAEHITLRDLTLKANIAGAGTAYEATSPTGGTPAERMTQVFNVDVTNAPNCYFNNGLNLFAGNRSLVDGCTISSPVTDADMSDSSINFRMQKAINFDGSYNAVVRNTVISGADTAVSVVMSQDVSTEGGTCMNVHADHIKTGFVFSVGINTRASVEVRNCDLTARDTGIQLINRDIYFLAENTFRQLSPTNALKDIDLQGCPYGTVVRNTFIGPLAGGRTNVSLAPSASYTYGGVTHSDICHDVIIGQNTLSGAATNAVTADASSYDIVITGNNDVTGPAFNTNSFTKANATVSYAYSGSLTNTASDPDGDVLSFCKTGGPAWLTVHFDGTLSGIPGTNDIGTNGTNVFTVRVMDNGGLHGADATMTITVTAQPPGLLVWPGSMTFESISNEDGTVTESAQGSGVGGATQTTTTGPGGLRLGDTAANAQFRSFVSFDTTLLPGDATVTNATLKLNRSTVVGTNPFTWGGAVAYVDIKGGSGFSGSTALQAGDFEAAADATNVVTMSAPANNGDWSVGTLNKNSLQYVARIGTDRTQLRVYLTPATTTNASVDYMGFWPGDATTQTNRPVFVVGYLRPNHAPAWNASPFAKTNATEAAAYAGSIASDATDSDPGDTLKFTKVSGSEWLTVATNGVLSGTPANSDVGTNTFVVRVTDTYGAAADATLNIYVINVNNAPIWNADPFAKADANEGAAYSDSIAADASDIDVGDTMTFSKTSGPAWLAVAATGALSGTPQHTNAGVNAFVVRVTDAAGLWAEATMNVNVIAANHAPVANDQSLTVAGDVATNLVLTATDVDNTNLTYSILANPAHGTLSGLDPNSGAVIYLPATYYYGPDVFTFTASDGSLYSTGMVSLIVTASVTTNTGTPLWWLAQYGLTNFNADALADPDGDGMPTWQEYIAGTNPTNAASSFWIASAGTTPQGGAIVRWPSISNRFYDLYRTTNLLTPFASLPGATNLPATPPENLYTNPGPDGPAAYYRVNVHQ